MIILAVPSLGSSPTQRGDATNIHPHFILLQYPHSGRAQRNSQTLSNLASRVCSCSTLTRVEPNATWHRRAPPRHALQLAVPSLGSSPTQLHHCSSSISIPQSLQYPHSGRAQRNTTAFIGTANLPTGLAVPSLGSSPTQRALAL